jgi:hypothetical protein
MKPTENIKRLIKNTKIKTNPAVNEAVLTDLLNKLDSSENIGLAAKQPNVWRIIMKSKITKYAAAAAVIVIAVVLSTTFLNKSVSPAYAIEQTIQACKNTRFIHFELFRPSNTKDKDAWLEYDDSGQIKNVRVNFYFSKGNELVMVWKQGRTQMWDKQRKKLQLFEDKIYTDKIIFFVQRYDPVSAVEHIQKMEKEGKVKIEIDEPSNKREPIILTAIYEPNTYALEGPKPQMKEVFSIDQSTKLVTAIELYELKDGQYSYIGVWKFPDYNIAFDAQIFNLEGELPSDVDIVDMMTLDIGLEQCDLTNEQIVIKVVREFFNALIAKDYEAAVKLFYHESPKTEAGIRRGLEKINVLRIISIDKPFPCSPMGTWRALCILEIEKDGQIARLEPNDIFVSHVLGHPTRWAIDTGSLGFLKLNL